MPNYPIRPWGVAPGSYPLASIGQDVGPVNPADPLLKKFPSFTTLTLQQREDVEKHVTDRNRAGFILGLGIGAAVFTFLSRYLTIQEVNERRRGGR